MVLVSILFAFAPCFSLINWFHLKFEPWVSCPGAMPRVRPGVPGQAAVCFLVFPLRCVFAPLNPAFTAPEIEFEFQD